MSAFVVDDEESVVVDATLFGTQRLPAAEPAERSEELRDAEQKAEDRARVLAIVSEYRTWMDVVDGGLWEQGRVIRPIKEFKLFLALDYKSFEAFAEAELDSDRRTATALIELASLFTKEQYLSLGHSRARVGALLLRATPEPDVAADLAHMRLRYGSGEGKLFTEATIREIEESIRGERGERVEKKAVKEIPMGLAVLGDNLKAAAEGVRFKFALSRSQTDAAEPCVDVSLQRVPVSTLPELLARMQAAALKSTN